MSTIEVRLHGWRSSTNIIYIEGKIRQALKGVTPEDIQDGLPLTVTSQMSHVEKGCVGGNSTCIQITIGEHELFDGSG